MSTEPDSLAAATAAVDSALPGLIRLALAHYTALATAEPAAQPKEQASQQQAAKAALAHLEALLRLARSGDPPPAEANTPTAEPADPAAMLRTARRAVHRLRG